MAGATLHAGSPARKRFSHTLRAAASMVYVSAAPGTCSSRCSGEERRLGGGVGSQLMGLPHLLSWDTE
jgi:hypothetical protein